MRRHRFIPIFLDPSLLCTAIPSVTESLGSVFRDSVVIIDGPRDMKPQERWLSQEITIREGSIMISDLYPIPPLPETRHHFCIFAESLPRPHYLEALHERDQPANTLTRQGLREDRFIPKPKDSGSPSASKRQKNRRKRKR